eukprot:9850831-Prorocentrum_lima.AAC.1
MCRWAESNSDEGIYDRYAQRQKAWEDVREQIRVFRLMDQILCEALLDSASAEILLIRQECEAQRE